MLDTRGDFLIKKKKKQTQNEKLRQPFAVLGVECWFGEAWLGLLIELSYAP